MTSTSDVLKMAAKPQPFSNEEKDWPEFRFRLENYLILVNEGFASLLEQAEKSKTEVPPAVGDTQQAVLVRGLSHMLYAVLATLTSGRCLRLVHRVPDRNGFEAWRKLVQENAPRTAGRRFAMLTAVLQPGFGRSEDTFEEGWKMWEHQIELYEGVAGSKLDDDVKVSVVMREAPQKLRENLLVNSS